MVKYEDIGTINTYCTATDDEGQMNRRNFTINIKEATYNTSIRSWWSNETDEYYRNETVNLYSIYEKYTHNNLTRALISHNELSYFLATSWSNCIACTDTFCWNTLELKNVTSYTDNFKTKITPSQQIDIYGVNWADYMDNLGIGDANEEIQAVSIWIQKV